MEELPTDLQAIVRTAAARMNLWTLSEFEAKNGIYLDKLINEEKVDIRKFSLEILDQLRNYTKDITEELASQDAFSRKIYDAYQGFRKQATAWSKLSEKVYYNDLQI